jgi:ABC-type branched-subunit amino acid transport system substrate-binding protein
MRKAFPVRTVLLIGVAVGISACSSAASTTTSPPTTVSGTTTAPGATAAITPAMSATKTACASSTSCWVSGNVSTVGGGIPGLFKGAWAGTDAYLAYQNSLGGVDGRKFKLLAEDDNLSCSNNKAQTQALVSSVIAFTGSFSLYDNCGAQIIEQHPNVPDVSVTLDQDLLAKSNVFAVAPAGGGVDAGPLQYFKKKFPQAITKVGVLVAGAGTAPAQWQIQKKAMEQLGYRILYERQFSPLETDFTSDVLKMQQSGVQMVSLVSVNDTYGGKLVADMQAQGFHPQVTWGGAAIYSGASPTQSPFITAAGGAAVADGIYLEQSAALYVGQDAHLVPEISTFVRWVHGLYPGFNIDLFTLYGWASAQLYVQALKAAGPHPTQSQLMASLRRIRTFSAGGMLSPTDPVAKKGPGCYLLAQIKNGSFERIDMPAGRVYRCGTVIHVPTS